MDEQEQKQSAQRRPLHLEDWHSWLDRTVAEAEQQGEFDNLPGHGKPLKFDANPLTGEIDVGHGLLKSAGMAPAWIELDKEIRAGLDSLATLRDEIARRLTSLTAPPTVPDPGPASSDRPRWWRILRRPRAPNPTTPRPANHRVLDAERARVRAQYMERAQELDGKIAAFNASLPPQLGHLERARLPQERAARDFDEACPPPRDRQEFGAHAN
ncbi:MAG: DnaJ subfamily er 28 [Thermomicrobiales bacterium]|jgi:hypothetical protein|nr:DnaJ subfamily er 28 [Thermomicrobiales bacterium]